jgi:hypothetical protein
VHALDRLRLSAQSIQFGGWLSVARQLARMVPRSLIVARRFSTDNSGIRRSKSRKPVVVRIRQMIAAVVFLAAHAVLILDPDLPGWPLDLCRALSWLTSGIFGVDIVVRLFLADERPRYLVRHWYDILVLALPLLRHLRLGVTGSAFLMTLITQGKAGVRRLLQRQCRGSY